MSTQTRIPLRQDKRIKPTEWFPPDYNSYPIGIKYNIQIMLARYLPAVAVISQYSVPTQQLVQASPMVSNLHHNIPSIVKPVSTSSTMSTREASQPVQAKVVTCDLILPTVVSSNNWQAHVVPDPSVRSSHPKGSQLSTKNLLTYLIVGLARPGNIKLLSHEVTIILQLSYSESYHSLS